MAAHGRDMHLFGDVAVFAAENVDSDHYCYTCEQSHPVPTSVDVLATGPSCKSLSLMFAQRDEYKDCFLSLFTLYSAMCLLYCMFSH